MIGIYILAGIVLFATVLATIGIFLAEHTPVTPELPKPPEGAHGAYVEPEHVKFKRTKFAERRAIPTQITRPALVNKSLEEFNEARRKDGQHG